MAVGDEQIGGRWNGLSRDQRRAARRARLIASAVRLYGSRGFRSTGVRAICQDAGLTERYFYESFANGEELLLAAFDDVVATMHACIVAAGEAAGTGASAEQRVRAMLTAYYAALSANPREARVFLVEIVGVDDAIDKAIDASLDRLLTPLLDSYDPGGRGPLVDPLLRRAVAGGLLHLALAWGADDYARPLAAVVAAAMTLCRLALPASPS